MARTNMAQLVIVLALAAALLHGTDADDHTVGGNLGWTRPSDSNFYSSWASNIIFEVGDTLVFNFATGAHHVAIVNKAAYDSCSVSNPIDLIRNGPATIPLNATGEHYYICGFTGHCASGQKLFVNVVADSDSTPGPSGSTSPPGSTTPSPPPPPSSASSSRGLTFTAIVMFIAVALFH